jgi:antitoxin (DNA-binding transcriptional repressor) of toxin-antitoxin stability system
MRAVALRDLQDHLGEYVHLAESGERVLITDRDRIVAELVPPREARSPWTGDSPLAEAVRKGWIHPPVSGALPLPSRTPIAPLSEILRELAKDRDDR